MSGPALVRLARMRPQELRFRVACEARKAAARLRCAVFAPQWDRSALGGALSRELPRSPAWTEVLAALRRRDHQAAHGKIATHFAARSAPFPLTARGVRPVAEAVHRAFPGAAADAARRADDILAGRYDLLGYRGIAAGHPPDWHRDPICGRRSPQAFWAAVPYLDPACGDHKVTWELNRHQHWLALGRAWTLTRDPRYRAGFVGQLGSWLSANPPLVGTNWASMLELAFRCLSWLWAIELFAGATEEEDGAPWLVDLLLALDRQLAHVEANLSYYFSPNTHLSGEALALYVAGLVLPELRASADRARIGRRVLVQEATRQIRSDGGHAEGSTHYHRYSTDFYLLAYAVARRVGDSAASVFEDAARRQARYLRTMTDDRGRRPAIGDDDGGQLFPICGRPADDCADTLAIAAILLQEPALAVEPAPEEAYWVCGPDASNLRLEGGTPGSTALASSGYYVSRTARGDHLVFDAGPHGYLNGGHAHADALSLTLTTAGGPLLVDPGTATYTMDEAVRDRFRGSSMHNTLVLDGRPQSVPRGAFGWASRTNAAAPIWRSSAGCDYVEGTHAAYAPVRHTRAVLAIHGIGWCILDHLLGHEGTAEHTVACYWHVHPAWECRAGREGACTLARDGTELALASSAPLELLGPGQHPEAFWSPAYGLLEPAPVAVATRVMPVPGSMATFIPALPDLAADVRVESLPLWTAPGGGWQGCAFTVQSRGGTLLVLAAIEEGGMAAADPSAPPALWGTAALRTDARVAVLVDRSPGGGSEAVLINGGLLIAGDAHELVSTGRRVPLLRTPTAGVASTVHQLSPR